MFSEQRWERLIMEFREENFRIYQLSTVSVFNTVLQDGLAALKTQYAGRQRARGQWGKPSGTRRLYSPCLRWLKYAFNCLSAYFAVNFKPPRWCSQPVSEFLNTWR